MQRLHFPFPFVALLVLLATQLPAQSFPGLNQDSYGGLYGVLLNPASLGGTRMNAELHLASAAVGLQSDYLTFAATNLPDALADDAYGRVVTDRRPAAAQTLYGSADVLGPSLLLRLGQRSGAAVFTRARTIQTTQGANGYLLEGLYGNFDALPTFTLAAADFSTTLHSWGELGLAFGTTLLRTPAHSLRAGATVKFLQGLGAVYTSGSIRGGAYHRETGELTVDGEVDFGRTDGYYLDELDPAARTGGAGFDVGLSYEWHPTRSHHPRYPFRYKLRAAVSVVDLGSIAYAAETTPYLLSGSVAALDIEGSGDVESVLADNYDGGTPRRENTAIQLPTTLHALLDYRLFGKLYLSALYSRGLHEQRRVHSSRVPNALTLTARYEGRGLGLYLPVTLRSGVSPTYGLGLRAGILAVGSGSIISHLVGEGGEAADIFLGLRLPLGRKRAENRELDI